MFHWVYFIILYLVHVRFCIVGMFVEIWTWFGFVSMFCWELLMRVEVVFVSFCLLKSEPMNQIHILVGLFIICSLGFWFLVSIQLRTKLTECTPSLPMLTFWCSLQVYLISMPCCHLKEKKKHTYTHMHTIWMRLENLIYKFFESQFSLWKEILIIIYYHVNKGYKLINLILISKLAVALYLV